MTANSIDTNSENAEGVAELELAVGRADFSALPAFGGLSEAELTRRYIHKTHRYRQKQFVLPDRVVVGTYFPSGPNLGAYEQAIRVGSRLFGSDPGSVVDDDPFEPKNAALLGILGGFGLPFAIAARDGTYHQSPDMARPNDEPRIAFAGVFASFCLDFHYPDNFMRAFLATPSYGLSIMWFRPVASDGIPLAFEQLGLGETIGTGFVRSINESQPMTSANTYVALLGDPTLRLQVVEPPSEAKLTANISFEWTPSTDTNATLLDLPWRTVLKDRGAIHPVPVTDKLTDFPSLSIKIPNPRGQTGLYWQRVLHQLSQGVFVESK